MLIGWAAIAVLVLALTLVAGLSAQTTNAGSSSPTTCPIPNTPPPPGSPATAPAPAPAPVQSAPSAYEVTTPSPRTLYCDGPDGRYLMDGPWLFRFGDGQYQSDASIAGWKAVQVPYAWNATDSSVGSYVGGATWYRKDFYLPDADPSQTWIVRFESVNYTAQAWLNGHPIGRHVGEFLPFELELPGHYLKHTGVNRLVVRVDSRHRPDSLPPGGVGPSGNLIGGGWWNYGGILREVYLRRVSRIDIADVLVRPSLPCPTCAAGIYYQVTATNYSPIPQSVHLTGSYGSQPVDLGTRSIPAGASATFTAATTVASPALWSPAHPNLYPVTILADVGGSAVARYYLESGIRSLVIAGGQLYLNGLPLHLRGVGLQEDSLLDGFAIDNATEDRYITEVRDLGADLIRSQYPLHPYLEEQADRQGILTWSEIPVFTVHESTLESTAFRRSALSELGEDIALNASHPSIAVWSIANELDPYPGGGQAAYIREAVALARRLDPTRPVGIAIQGYPTVGCQGAYAPLQVIGINDYFGWYAGPGGSIADRALLSSYLDQVRACYPNKGLMVTEFGAEANRPGPVEERGTYAFQSDFVDYHLGVFASKPWLAGAIYWALEEFRVKPGWGGGDPRPDPPVHGKGLVSLAGFKKPAYYEIQRLYGSTQQVG